MDHEFTLYLYMGRGDLFYPVSYRTHLPFWEKNFMESTSDALSHSEPDHLLLWIKVRSDTVLIDPWNPLREVEKPYIKLVEILLS